MLEALIKRIFYSLKLMFLFFFQLMSALKSGAVANSRFAMAAELSSEKISVDRSGGGV